jgi:hypothetical protein
MEAVFYIAPVDLPDQAERKPWITAFLGRSGGYAVLTDWKRQGSAIKIAEAAATAAPPKAVPIIRSLG